MAGLVVGFLAITAFTLVAAVATALLIAIALWSWIDSETEGDL